MATRSRCLPTDSSTGWMRYPGLAWSTPNPARRRVSQGENFCQIRRTVRSTMEKRAGARIPSASAVQLAVG